MPSLTVSNDYTQVPGWYTWGGRSDVFVSEGWKLHVGGTETTAQIIINQISGVLKELEIDHKFARDTVSLSSSCLSPRNAGKFCAIYPATIIQAFIAVDAIDSKLKPLGYTHANVVQIPTDRQVGASCVFARYGGYMFDYVLKMGELVAYNPDAAYKPDWIEDPWLQFNSWNRTTDRTILDKFVKAFPMLSKDQIKTLSKAAKANTD